MGDQPPPGRAGRDGVHPLFQDRGHHRIVIDPNAANTRAIHAYETVGFRRVGVMREYEWSAHEQRWTDGLLMDLLRGQLVEG